MRVLAALAPALARGMGGVRLHMANMGELITYGAETEPRRVRALEKSRCLDFSNRNCRAGCEADPVCDAKRRPCRNSLLWHWPLARHKGSAERIAQHGHDTPAPLCPR